MERDNINQISSNVPAFLVKLWKLVQDPKVDDLISWSKTGTTFCVHNPVVLSRDVLPMYFKHNNFTSFVRQLNMYGFKKVVSSEHGGIKPDKDEWEFHHPNFVKGRADLLDHVKRKVHPEEKKMRNEEFSVIMEDVKELQIKHSAVQNRLESLKLENEDLWREVGDLRIKHKKQQHVLNKLIKFLILVYGGNSSEGVNSRKRLAIEPGQSTSKKMRSGQLSEVEEGDNTQYSVESPVCNEDLFSMDLDSSNSGPQIVVLPDEPETPPKIQTISSVPNIEKSHDSRSDHIQKSDKHKSANSGKSKDISTKSKKEPLKLQIPTMVPYNQRREPNIDFSPSLFDGLSQLFPVDNNSYTGQLSKELQKSFIVNDSSSALVPARFNSSVGKDDIDFDVDQISGSLDSLHDMLSGPQYEVDSQTLHQLFDSDGTSIESKAAGFGVGSVLEKLEAVNDDQANDNKTETQDETESENLKPFSPGMFLNDVGLNETSNDSAGKEELQDDSSLL